MPECKCTCISCTYGIEPAVHARLTASSMKELTYVVEVRVKNKPSDPIHYAAKFVTEKGRYCWGSFLNSPALKKRCVSENESNNSSVILSIRKVGLWVNGSFQASDHLAGVL